MMVVMGPKSFSSILIYVIIIYLYSSGVSCAERIQIDLWNEQYEHHEYINLIDVYQYDDYLKINANNVCVPVVFKIDPISMSDISTVKWDWKIEASNYKLKSNYDSYASVAFIAKYGLFRYRVLRYLWITSDKEIMTFIESPYSGRTTWIVKQNIKSYSSTWITEKVDIQDDFVKAFGSIPNKIIAISVFPDSNDTNEKFKSYYRSVIFD